VIDTPLIRVLIVDDNEVVRRGLSLFLKAFDDFEMVGEATNGVEAVRLCAVLQPDVVLMDVIMPEMDGIVATEIIHREQPNVGVLALSSLKDDTLVEKMMKAGAVGYLLKNVSIDELAEAIRRGKWDNLG
jgi:NarL family two-component system response regulator LiaR